jgi:predicted ribosomally synthesized peptide with SipW-like signal peptide
VRRNIILAVVVIAALSLAGASGVFATWSDSEISFNNTIRTGSLDLKVNGADDEPWGEGVPTKVDIDCMVPCKYYGPYEVELWNGGQCNFPSHAYIHLKSFVCSNIEPKVNPYPCGGSYYWYENYGLGATTGYPAPPYDPNAGQLKTEPELVAEWGGKVDCTWVPGIGAEGDECSLGTHIEMIATNSSAPPNDAPETVIHRDKIVKWKCLEIYLFDLMPCQAKTIYLWFHMQQDPEEMYGFNFIPGPGDEDFPDPTDYPTMEEFIEAYNAALLHWQKFNDWPSWALMKDKVVFEIEFDLWLEDTPGTVVSPVY